MHDEGTLLRPTDVTLPGGGLWARLPAVGVAVGVAALLLAWLLGGGDREQLYHSYLFAYVYFLSLALGGLFFVLLHYATRAGWSVVVRRLAEHLAGTLPLFLLLFLPIAWGIHDLYHWSHPEVVTGDPILEGKAGYLSVPFFLFRAAVILGLWSFLGWGLRRGSLRQDGGHETEILARMQRWSPLGLVLFAVTATIAAFDWLMSLNPHWYSTMFGVYFFAGCAVSVFALLALLAAQLERSGRLHGVVTSEHFHDLGKLLFAFVVFWAYIAFSQFMLIWYANLPEETVFFAARWQAGWKTVSVALAAGHFGVPFFFLLPRDVKRRRGPLVAAALWVLAMHALDMFWLVMPSLGRGFHVSPLDLLSFLGVGGLFLGTLAYLLRRPALVPVRDPRLPESLSFENV